MANDRIVMKCDTCGAWKTMMKHHPGSLSTTDTGFFEWLNAHAQCHPDYFAVALKSGPCFSLHTEKSFKDPAILPSEKNGAMPPDLGE